MSGSSPSLRRALAGLAALGLVACAVPLALAIHSVGGHHRDLIAVFGPVIGGASIGTGLLAWYRRPENRFGALLAAVGFSYCISGLIVSTDPWPFIAGLALIAVPYAILFHILLAFPSGRLGDSRPLALAMYLTATVFWWACLVIEDTAQLGGLPANPLLIAAEPGLFEALSRIRLAVVALLIAILLVVVARRWRDATRPQRRALTPVYASGGLVLALYAVWSVLGVAQAWPDVQENLERARVIALAAVPFAFLAGLLRSRVAEATAVSELVTRLPHRSLRDALAEALDDPSLTLAYWRTDKQTWVDADGTPLGLPEDRGLTPVEHDGQPVALLIHDPSVSVAQAVGDAAALALENERLAAELRANVKELRASRARIVESADAARRKIERDLHDGAQQRLVALALSLRLARRKVDGEAAELLDRASADLDAAIAELRELARGIHPAVLSDRGLTMAIEALAQRMPLPIEVSGAPAERLPEPVEAAAYFMVAEAITNVVRYAHATHARVDLTLDAGQLVVEVCDDGIGGADPANGTGLRGLSDRIAALDGRLEVESHDGTTVRAVIPR